MDVDERIPRPDSHDLNHRVAHPGSRCHVDAEHPGGRRSERQLVVDGGVRFLSDDGTRYGGALGEGGRIRGGDTRPERGELRDVSRWILVLEVIEAPVETAAARRSEAMIVVGDEEVAPRR